MSSEFEKFINNNREDFDDANPSQKVWKEVEKTLPVTKQNKKFSLIDIYKWSAAAAIFFVVLTSVYFLFIRKNSHEKETIITEAPKSGDINGITPEYAVQLNQVSRSVEIRQKELQSAASAEPELYKQFIEDLSTLDSSYRMLKNQATQTPNRDVIIRAMIQNLQLQAELLGRQLKIFDEYKNTKKLKDEKNI